MFLGIPPHTNSKEITTFSWKGKQNQFTRVPQDYKKSPIITSNTLRWALDSFHPPEEVTLFSYVDDHLLITIDEYYIKQ